MKERPILYSTPMVCAILNDTKTQTRRVIKETLIEKYENYREYCSSVAPQGVCSHVSSIHEFMEDRCPYGKAGDRLWVRETFLPLTRGYAYRADGIINENFPLLKWKPSIHMPRLASRITLEIISVRVEKLNDISEEDAEREGIAIPEDIRRPSNRILFQSLWESINGEDSWEQNPWVWVIEFKRVQP